MFSQDVPGHPFLPGFANAFPRLANFPHAV